MSLHGHLNPSITVLFCFCRSFWKKTTPYLQKQVTCMRKPISAAEYLAVTLRFLATGESYSSLEFHFRISKSTLSNMIPFVFKVIYTVLKDDYLACPQVS